MSNVKKNNPLKQARLGRSSIKKHKVVSVRMAAELVATIKQALEDNGLGIRKRSAWISDAIGLLDSEFSTIDIQDKILFLNQAQSIKGEGSALPITLSDDACLRLSQMRLFCEQHAPEIKDSQSRIIHLAITLKLVRLNIKLA